MIASRLTSLLAEAQDEQDKAERKHNAYHEALVKWVGGDGSIIKSLLWSEGVHVVSVVPFGLGDGVWEKGYNSGVLSPHWLLSPYKLQLHHGGFSESFHTVDAAYQAQKWWHVDTAREDFSSANSISSVEGFKVKYKMTRRDGGFEKYGAMLRALSARYMLPSQAARLLETSGKFLLCCHPGPADPSQCWSDGAGCGENKFGHALMTVRSRLSSGKKSTPSWPAGVSEQNWKEIVADLAHHCRVTTAPH